MRPLSLFRVVLLTLAVLLVAGAVGGLLAHLAPTNLREALTERETLFALEMSIRTSLISLALALLIGIPAAHLLTRASFPGKALIETVLDIPLVTLPLVAGVGLLFMLGHGSPLVQLLSRLGIEVLFTQTGIILAQTYVALSMVIRSARAAFSEVDEDYPRMAATLGLTPGRALLLVEIPMAGKGLATAAILGWARALGEFGATLMVAGATRLQTETLPVAVFLNIASGETDLAVACAVLLLALAFILLLFVRLIANSRAFLRPEREARHA